MYNYSLSYTVYLLRTYVYEIFRSSRMTAEPFREERRSRQIAIDKLTANYHEFEEKIGYKFNNIGYLLQALTHASYQYNQVSFFLPFEIFNTWFFSLKQTKID